MKSVLQRCLVLLLSAILLAPIPSARGDSIEPRAQVHRACLAPPSIQKNDEETFENSLNFQLMLQYLSDNFWVGPLDTMPRHRTIERMVDIRDNVRRDFARINKEVEFDYLDHVNLADEIIAVFSFDRHSFAVRVDKKTWQREFMSLEDVMDETEAAMASQDMAKAGGMLQLLRAMPEVKVAELFMPEEETLLQLLMPFIHKYRKLPSRWDSLRKRLKSILSSTGSARIAKLNGLLMHHRQELCAFLEEVHRDLSPAAAIANCLHKSKAGCDEIARDISTIRKNAYWIIRDLNEYEDAGDRSPVFIASNILDCLNDMKKILSPETVVKALARQGPAGSRLKSWKSIYALADRLLEDGFSAEARHDIAWTLAPLTKHWGNKARYGNTAGARGLVLLCKIPGKGFHLRLNSAGNALPLNEYRARYPNAKPGKHGESLRMPIVVPACTTQFAQPYTKTEWVDLADALRDYIWATGYRSLEFNPPYHPVVILGDESLFHALLDNVMAQMDDVAGSSRCIVTLKTVMRKNVPTARIQIEKDLPRRITLSDGSLNVFDNRGIPVAKRIVNGWGGKISLMIKGLRETCIIEIPAIPAAEDITVIGPLWEGKIKDAVDLVLNEADSRLRQKNEKRLHLAMVHYLFCLQIRHRDPLRFAQTYSPMLFAGTSPEFQSAFWGRVDDVYKWLDGAIQEAYPHRYDALSWQRKLMVLSAFKDVVDLIADEHMGALRAHLNLQIGRILGTLNRHEEKRRYYEAALAFYLAHPNDAPQSFEEDLPPYAERIKVLQRILRPKPPGFNPGSFVAGGVEMELKVFFEYNGKRLALPFEALPRKVTTTLAKKISAVLQKEIPDAPFRITMDWDDWEFVSHLILVPRGDGQKLPALLRDVQDRMLDQGIPLFQRELHRVLKKNKKLRKMLADEFDAAIEDLFASGRIRSGNIMVQCALGNFHINKSEPPEASDKNLQGLPGLMSLVFLRNRIPRAEGPPVKDAGRHKIIRGLDSANPARGQSNDYAPGRNELLVKMGFSHERHSGSPIYEAGLQSMLRHVPPQAFATLEQVIARKFAPGKERRMHREGLRAAKAATLHSNRVVDLREIYLSVPLAVLSWYQKSDLGEGHRYDHPDIPVLGYSEIDDNRVLRELNASDTGRWDKPLTSLGGKSFRGMLHAIVHDENFVVEYLSYYGTVEQYLCLLAMATPGGPEIRQLMDSSEYAEFAVPNPKDRKPIRALYRYVFDIAENDAGYSLYPAETAYRRYHYFDEEHPRDINVSGRHTKRGSTSHFVLTLPKTLARGRNRFIIIRMHEKDKLDRARRIIREGREFERLEDLRLYLGLGAEVTPSSQTLLGSAL